MSRALLPSELKVGMHVTVLRRANPDNKSGMSDVGTIVAVDLPRVVVERHSYGTHPFIVHDDVNEVQFGTAPEYCDADVPTYGALRESIKCLLTTTDAIESVLAGERGKCTIRKIARVLLDAQGTIYKARRLVHD